jgi:hypothetical protein
VRQADHSFAGVLTGACVSNTVSSINVEIRGGLGPNWDITPQPEKSSCSKLYPSRGSVYIGFHFHN